MKVPTADMTASHQSQAEATVALADLDPADQRLLTAARDVRARAYAPYSGFAVGAAVVTRSGAIHTGVNVENASYGLTVCAEVTALAQAVGAGDFDVLAIAVVGGPVEANGQTGTPTTPCGRCRQVIQEAAGVSGADIRVLCADAGLTGILVTSIARLLPHAFGPHDPGGPG